MLTLKPGGERSMSADELAQQLNRQLSSITGARVSASQREHRADSTTITRPLRPPMAAE